MVVQNRSTKKMHTLLKANWLKMPDKHKALFNIINENDTDPELKVVGDLTPNENTQTKKPKKKNES